MTEKETEEPTFPICRGCPEYSECCGGHPEDCEIGYEDMQKEKETKKCHN
jgi:hypothetical protein